MGRSYVLAEKWDSDRASKMTTLLKDLQDAWSLRGHKACNDLMQVLKNALKPEIKKGTITGRPFADAEKVWNKLISTSADGPRSARRHK